jgi:hypothetical protein
MNHWTPAFAAPVIRMTCPWKRVLRFGAPLPLPLHSCGSNWPARTPTRRAAAASMLGGRVRGPRAIREQPRSVRDVSVGEQREGQRTCCCLAGDMTTKCQRLPVSMCALCNWLCENVSHQLLRVW